MQTTPQGCNQQNPDRGRLCRTPVVQYSARKARTVGLTYIFAIRGKEYRLILFCMYIKKISIEIQIKDFFKKYLGRGKLA